jgi:hypothetical protein
VKEVAHRLAGQWPASAPGSDIEKLGSTDKAMVIAAAREILARPGTVDNQWVRRLAAMRWVQLDARAFFMEKEEKCPPALLEAALLAWCRSDPASALRWLAYRGEKVSCWGTAMADICRSSPLLVKDYIQEAERGDFPCIDAKMDPVVMHEGPEELLAALVLQIGLHADPAWAMQHRERLGSLTEGPAAHVLNHWAGLDAAAAVAWSTGLVEQKDVWISHILDMHSKRTVEELCTSMFFATPQLKEQSIFFELRRMSLLKPFPRNSEKP